MQDEPTLLILRRRRCLRPRVVHRRQVVSKALSYEVLPFSSSSSSSSSRRLLLLQHEERTCWMMLDFPEPECPERSAASHRNVGFVVVVVVVAVAVSVVVATTTSRVHPSSCCRTPSSHAPPSPCPLTLPSQSPRLSRPRTLASELCGYVGSAK